MKHWWDRIIKAHCEFTERWNADPDTYDNPEQHRATPMEKP